MGIIADKVHNADTKSDESCEACGSRSGSVVLSRGRYGRRLCTNCLFGKGHADGGRHGVAANCEIGLPATKKVPLFACFACGEMRAAVKMSICLIICRDCLVGYVDESGRAKEVLTERTVERVRKFLRRRL